MTIRPTTADDIDAIGAIYSKYVASGVATFEVVAPDREELLRRFGAVTSRTLHRQRGFTDAGRLAAVAFKHGKWLDTLLLQRSLDGPAGR
ncbi:GNAT family N-acetyltransferase [Mycolicibacterium vanbaalenii]|uniref:GNAT family N-acetyltransferase n=1 Tax=Mycolicibacterium vanbaalenii TaxID=110539 RepID=UPI001F31832B|nr:hypothetical protein [Mycolicibacterium vanbaalenii]